jgi:hypothetical protein
MKAQILGRLPIFTASPLPTLAVEKDEFAKQKSMGKLDFVSQLNAI